MTGPSRHGAAVAVVAVVLQLTRPGVGVSTRPAPAAAAIDDTGPLLSSEVDLRPHSRSARASRGATRRPLRQPKGVLPRPGSARRRALLWRIALCESGGDPRDVSATGRYRGAWQFDAATWASVGGSGDPAAAPLAEQRQRAGLLYERRGLAPWPRCGRRAVRVAGAAPAEEGAA